MHAIVLRAAVVEADPWVAVGLLEADGESSANVKPVARTVELGDERLQRLELKLTGKSGAEREVHVYEAYWAPLTEGHVKLRDVAAFLPDRLLDGRHAGWGDARVLHELRHRQAHVAER